jgi:hypothetical protein
LEKATVGALHNLTGKIDIKGDPYQEVQDKQDLDNLYSRILNWVDCLDHPRCTSFKWFDQAILQWFDSVLLDIELVIPRPMIGITYEDWFERNSFQIKTGNYQIIELTKSFVRMLTYMEQVIQYDLQSAVRDKFPELNENELLEGIHKFVLGSTNSLVSLGLILLLFLLYEENGNKANTGISENFMLNWLTIAYLANQDLVEARNNKVLRMSIENAKSVMISSKMDWVYPVPLNKLKAALSVGVPDKSESGVKLISKEYSYSQEEVAYSPPTLH